MASLWDNPSVIHGHCICILLKFIILLPPAPHEGLFLFIFSLTFPNAPINPTCILNALDLTLPMLLSLSSCSPTVLPLNSLSRTHPGGFSHRWVWCGVLLHGLAWASDPLQPFIPYECYNHNFMTFYSAFQVPKYSHMTFDHSLYSAKICITGVQSPLKYIS